MKILVISDIHAMSKDLLDLKAYKGVTGSSFTIENRSPAKNPLLAIALCLANEKGRIDALLCLGDVAHQAKTLVFQAAWHDIQFVAAQLEISNVFAVTGNHDLDSRADNSTRAFDRIEYLKQIHPPYPSSHESFNSEYFSNGLACKELGNCLFVAIDTCRIHGLGGPNADTIFNIGDISEKMIGDLHDKLNSSSCTHTVVAMHHHPLRVDEVIDPDYDAIPSGGRLLEVISSSNKKAIVVHGHKHISNVRQSPTGPGAPYVFAASSLAAAPYKDQELFFTNQFHIVDLDLTDTSKLVGAIYSWDRGPTSWAPSNAARMPHYVPFGVEPDINLLASQLVAGPARFVKPAELLQICPDLKFANVRHIERVNSQIESYGRKLIHNRGKIEGLVYSEHPE